MSKDQWNAVDSYIDSLLVHPEAALAAALEATLDAGLPPISVSPSQGKLLQLLIEVQGARKVLEIGTLGGYSTIWMARPLPADGRLITLELDPKHVEVARANLARAQLQATVEVRPGKALDTLAQIEKEQVAPFDFVFIDADKQSTPEYFAWALRLTRVGGLIVVDNVVRNGAVIDSHSADPAIQGMRRFYDLVAREPRVTATAIQTVGSKGYDGFAVARVTKAAG